ncbi:hypothetical protein WJX74_004055 [Apatococcus lobatus]|uniref:Uncharacterized protein n=1 Tax=Apatococcus lobatus TaxID=904363 RepID=A0AAW1S8Z3_9CHLO
MPGGQSHQAGHGRDGTNSQGYQSLSQAVIGLHQSPSRALRSPRQAKRRAVLAGAYDSSSQDQLGSQRKYVYGDPDAGALSQLSDIITLESSQQGPAEQQAPAKEENAPLPINPDSLQGSLPHLSQEFPDSFNMQSQPAPDFDNAEAVPSQSSRPGFSAMSDLPGPGEALANALKGSHAPDWQQQPSLRDHEDLQTGQESSHLHPLTSGNFRHQHIPISSQPMVPTSINLPPPSHHFAPAGSNSDLTGMAHATPSAGYPPTSAAVQGPLKAKATRRGPMDEMRQLVRILVKLIPHSVDHIATSEEGGGGNRISEEQIKVYLDSTLGDAPRPAWGIPNGWGDYVAVLFSWATGVPITRDQAMRCAKREPGRSWEALDSELAKLGLYPASWTLPLNREGLGPAPEAPLPSLPAPQPSQPLPSSSRRLSEERGPVPVPASGRRRAPQHAAAGQAHRRAAPPLTEEDHLPELELYTRAHRLLLAASHKIGSTPIEHSEPVIKARNDIRLVWNSILERSGHMAPHCSAAEMLHYPVSAPSSQDIMYAPTHLSGYPVHGSSEAVPVSHFRSAYPVMLRGADGKMSQAYQLMPSQEAMPAAAFLEAPPLTLPTSYEQGGASCLSQPLSPNQLLLSQPAFHSFSPPSQLRVAPLDSTAVEHPRRRKRKAATTLQFGSGPASQAHRSLENGHSPRLASPSVEQPWVEEDAAQDHEATPSTDNEQDAEDQSRAGSHPHADTQPLPDAHHHMDSQPHIEGSHSQPNFGAFPPVGPYDGPPLYKPSPVKHKRQANGVRGGRASPSKGMKGQGRRSGQQAQHAYDLTSHHCEREDGSVSPSGGKQSMNASNDGSSQSQSVEPVLLDGPLPASNTLPHFAGYLALPSNALHFTGPGLLSVSAGPPALVQVPEGGSRHHPKHFSRAVKRETEFRPDNDQDCPDNLSRMQPEPHVRTNAALRPSISAMLH